MTRIFCRKSFLILSLLAVLSSASLFLRAQEAPVDAREIDRRHLGQIHKSLMAFKQDKGHLPDWLSDLFPKYLADPEILLSPKDKSPGQSGKMKSSYIYEFNGSPQPWQRGLNGEEITMKEWKMIQLESFGEAMPILRCLRYDPTLNMSYSGEIYETVLVWEADPRALALMKRIGPGKVSKPEGTIRLKVMAKDGQPLEGVEISSEKYQTTFASLAPRWIVTDARGEAAFPIGPGKALHLELKAAKPGYACGSVSWDKDSIPAECSFQLEPAMEVGGVVLSQSGGAIAGATVIVNAVVRDNVGQSIETPCDTVTSDAQGRWIASSVPKNAAALEIRVQHRDFMTGEFEQADAGSRQNNTFSMADLKSKTAELTLEPGIEITGRVTGDSGTTISNAVVLITSSATLDERTEIKTDSVGNFKIMRLDTRPLHLLASAQGCQPAYCKLTVERGMKPVMFELKKGQPWTFTVLDDSSKPVPGAKVELVSWNNLALLSWSAITDNAGECVWDTQPQGTVVLQASKDDYVSCTLTCTAGSQDKGNFHLNKLFKMAGTAADADTGQPLEHFTVYPGFTFGPNSQQRTTWRSSEGIEGRNGVFIMPARQRFSNVSFKYLAVADGYLPAESRVFSSSEQESYTFKLRKGKGPSGQVLLPNGEPAAGAQVGILGWDYLYLNKASMRVNARENGDIAKTDDQGRFQMRAVTMTPELVIVHKEGYAEISGSDLAKSNRVTLQPWAAVNGIYKTGTKPGTNMTLMIAYNNGPFSGLFFDSENFHRQTDADGRFAFTHIPPGRRSLARLIQTSPTSWGQSEAQELDLQPGRTLDLAYGGQGQPVRGQLIARDKTKSMDWHNANGSLDMPILFAGKIFSNPAERKSYLQSDEYREALKKRKQYRFTVNTDGSFVIDNVTAGTYQLRIDLHAPANPNNPSDTPIIGYINKEITVPEAPGGGSDTPMDLDELEL